MENYFNEEKLKQIKPGSQACLRDRPASAEGAVGSAWNLRHPCFPKTNVTTTPKLKHSHPDFTDESRQHVRIEDYHSRSPVALQKGSLPDPQGIWPLIRAVELITYATQTRLVFPDRHTQLLGEAELALKADLSK